MARNLAVWIATLLASIVPFVAVVGVLDRSIFGSGDTAISIGLAAAYSFGVTCLVCAPVQQFLPENRQGAWSYALSYIIGIMIAAELINIFTRQFLGWPLDRQYSRTVGENFIETLVFGLLMVPLAIVTAGAFEILMNVLAKFFPPKQNPN